MFTKALPERRRWPTSACAALAVCVAAFCAVAVPASAGAATVGDYTFQDTLAASSGPGAPLTDVGPGTNSYATETVAGESRAVLRFPAGNGVRFSTAGLDEYSLVILMRFEAMEGQFRYARVTDTSNRTADEGLYFWNGLLEFYPTQPRRRRPSAVTNGSRWA